MSAALKTAAVQHALDVAQIYKDNATLTRGLPQAQPRLRVHDEPLIADPQPAGPALITPAVPAGNSQSSWIKPLTIGTAALLGASGLGAGAGTAYWLLHRDPDTTIVNQQTADESLLQSLEDRGFHLSPEKRVVQ